MLFHCNNKSLKKMFCLPTNIQMFPETRLFRGLSTKFHELAHSSLYAQKNDGNSHTFCDLGYDSYFKKKKKKRNKLSCDEESISCVKNNRPKTQTFKAVIALMVNILKLVVC